jgi:organic radical activating enzyme
LHLNMGMEQQIKFFKQVKDRLDAVGPGFCAMKWLHQTLYLHTGDNHSCYHPKPHHIELDEITHNPAALHNTAWKKQQRKAMLEGERPKECYYCWNIEDLPGKHSSDRVLHSGGNPWAEQAIEKLAQLPWDADINPKYLEVSFGNNCNFRCGYCGPQASTMWMEEVKKHGDYDITHPQYSIDFLKNGTYYGPKDDNPYIDAFWKWWPSLRKDLHTLRITGGEPLMNSGAMDFFELLDREPAPELEISINSNLGVSFGKVDRFIEQAKKLLQEKKIKTINIFTSIDSWGPQAEYMRTGLNCEHWERNMLEFVKLGKRVNFMCTFNVLCVTNYKKLLEKVIEWRKQYGSHLIHLDIPYLKDPPHWMINILTPDFMVYMEDTLKFMEDNAEWFELSEIVKFRRVTEYMRTNPVDAGKIHRGRRDFYVFFTENDRRLGTNLLELFPEYTDFYQLCKETYESNK